MCFKQINRKCLNFLVTKKNKNMVNYDIFNLSKRKLSKFLKPEDVLTIFKIREDVILPLYKQNKDIVSIERRLTNIQRKFDNKDRYAFSIIKTINNNGFNYWRKCSMKNLKKNIKINNTIE